MNSKSNSPCECQSDLFDISDITTRNKMVGTKGQFISKQHIAFCTDSFSEFLGVFFMFGNMKHQRSRKKE